MITRVEIKNRFVINVFDLLESAMLNIILKVFIRELNDNKFRKKITREIITFNKSLKLIYNLIKKTHRINIEI